MPMFIEHATELRKQKRKVENWRELGDTIASREMLKQAAEERSMRYITPTQRHHSIAGGRGIDLQLSPRSRWHCFPWIQ